jgi:hypothetical protein
MVGSAPRLPTRITLFTPLITNLLNKVNVKCAGAFPALHFYISK